MTLKIFKFATSALGRYVVVLGDYEISIENILPTQLDYTIWYKDNRVAHSKFWHRGFYFLETQILDVLQRLYDDL